MKQTKINKLFISASLFPCDKHPQRGIFVETRLEHLKEQIPDTRISIFSPRPYFPIKHKFFKDHKKLVGSLKVKYLQYLSLPIIGRFFSYNFVANKLEKHLIKEKPDIIIAEYAYPDGLALAKLGRVYNIPVIISARGSDISYFLSHNIMKKKLSEYLPYINHFISVSNDMSEDLKKIGIEDNKITVIGNGVDFDIFKPHKKSDNLYEKYNLPKNKKIILSVGGLIPRKGHDLAINTIAKLKDIHLVIIGEGKEENELRLLTEKLKIKDRVHFLGRKSHKEIAEIYSLSDLFLLCSHSEGRANVLLEAAACGCPLLSSNVQGSNEIITNDKIGKIFTEKSPDNLVNTIKEMLFKEYDREYISKSVSNHNWEKCGKKYADLLRNVF